MKIIHLNREAIQKEHEAHAMAEYLRLKWKARAERRVQKIMSQTLGLSSPNATSKTTNK
jgi:hypothetical protein